MKGVRLRGVAGVVGRIVEFCEEPNTGLAVLEVDDPERDDPWRIAVPVACLRAQPDKATPAELAHTLTSAQVRALLLLPLDGWVDRTELRGVWATTLRVLERQGLVEVKVIRVVTPHRLGSLTITTALRLRLTRRGLDVRNELQLERAE